MPNLSQSRKGESLSYFDGEFDVFSTNRSRPLSQLVTLHSDSYPNIGEDENKVESAYHDDLKTVGYGRHERQCFTFYNNPFDPRLTFKGLGYLLLSGSEDMALSAEQMAQNVFLALEDSDLIIDEFFNKNRYFYQSLCQSNDVDLRVDPNRYKIVPEMDGNVSDDGSEECKRLFEKVSSLKIKDIWNPPKEAKNEAGRITFAAERQVEKEEEKKHTTDELTAKSEVNPLYSGEATTTTDCSSSAETLTSKTHLYVKNCDGKRAVQKSLISQNIPGEEKARCEGIVRDMTGVVNNDSQGMDEVDNAKKTPCFEEHDTDQRMSSEPEDKGESVPSTLVNGGGNIPDSKSRKENNCWAKLFDKNKVKWDSKCTQNFGKENSTKISSTTAATPVEYKQPKDVDAYQQNGSSTVSSLEPSSTKTNTRPIRCSIKDYKPPTVPTIIPDHFELDDIVQTGQDNGTSHGQKHITQTISTAMTEKQASTSLFPQMNPVLTSFNFSTKLPTVFEKLTTSSTSSTGPDSKIIDTIVANSVLRPSVQSFYPGNCNKASTTYEIVTGGHGPQQPQTQGNNSNSHSVAVPVHTTSSVEQMKINCTQSQTQVAHTLQMDSTSTGHFQTSTIGPYRDPARTTKNNHKPVHHPYIGGKDPMQQQAQHAAALLQMASCLQQGNRRETACTFNNAAQVPNRVNVEQAAPARPNTYQYPFNPTGPVSHFQGQTMLNPPPGFQGVLTNQARVTRPLNQNPPIQTETLPPQQGIPGNQFQFRNHGDNGFQPQQHQTGGGNRFGYSQNPNQCYQQYIQQPPQQQQQPVSYHQHLQPPQHQQQQQQVQQPPPQYRHQHLPLHPLQPQPQYLNPCATSFQNFNQTQAGQLQNARPNWEFNQNGENTNCNNSNVDVGGENVSSTAVIILKPSKTAEQLFLGNTAAEDPGVTTTPATTEDVVVKVRRKSMSAESIPSLVQSDHYRDGSKDKNKMSKFRSRRTNLVRIYPTKDTS